MPAYYWFKLYDEILNDPKMGKMSDRLYRRSIEMMAFANQHNQDGKLPPVDDMAWILRCDETELLQEMRDLASDKYRILTHEGDDWIVTNFSSRQERVSDAERQRRKRERDRQGEYYGHEDDTNTDDTSHEAVTDRDTELKIESEIEIESEEKREEQISAPAPENKPENVVLDGDQTEDDPEYVDLDSDQTGDDDFTRLQHALERVIGLPISQGDIPPIRKMTQIGATREDIQAAAEWMASQGRTIRYVGQLYGPVETQVAKRKQAGLARGDPVGEGGKSARKNSKNGREDGLAAVREMIYGNSDDSNTKT